MDASTPKLVAAQSTTVSLIKAGNTKLCWVSFYNPGNALAYVQCFDAAAAVDVTLGTTVPKLAIPVPSAGFANILMDRSAFLLGLCVAAATTATGASAPNAAQVVNLGVR